MLFNSLQFLLFFIIVCSIYYLLPLVFRWIWLLIASCYFYAVLNPSYLLILFTAISIDYGCGLALQATQAPVARKWILALSILSNLAILGYFKYYNFFVDNLLHASSFLATPLQLSYLNLALPIGLSFHTFQSMSYCIEVYRRRQVPEKNAFVFSLYVMFFPQLVAGPIERPYHLLQQLREKKLFSVDNIKAGLTLMAWGLFKKVVIADRLAVYVENVYAAQHQYSSLALFISAIFFSFQIYGDFSGYSDMARGAAKVMGYDLMVNFNLPYMSVSLKEFWTRWHISLSTWFRDYVYIPLGGSNVSPRRYTFNILLVFLISGFWHGANWTFIVWGLLHALFLLTSVYISGKFMHHRLPKFAGLLITFLFVTLTWVYFRSNTVANANAYLYRLLSFAEGMIANEYFSIRHILFSILLIIALLYFERSKLLWILSTKYFYWKAALFVLLIYFLGIFSQAQFIYFQF